MALERYFVIRHGNDWLVTLDGRPMARHESRASATADAIAMAAHTGSKDHDADVMVEPEAGEPPELVWSFGDDPPPDGAHTDGHSHVRHVQRAGIL